MRLVFFIFLAVALYVALIAIPSPCLREPHLAVLHAIANRTFSHLEEGVEFRSLPERKRLRHPGRRFDTLITVDRTFPKRKLRIKCSMSFFYASMAAFVSLVCATPMRLRRKIGVIAIGGACILGLTAVCLGVLIYVSLTPILASPVIYLVPILLWSVLSWSDIRNRLVCNLEKTRLCERVLWRGRE